MGQGLDPLGCDDAQLTLSGVFQEKDLDTSTIVQGVFGRVNSVLQIHTEGGC